MNRNLNLKKLNNNMENKETFTIEEVLDLLATERRRAVDICYEFKEEFEQKYKYQTNAGNKLAFISEDIANECRIIGNTISGGNALSAALGETLEDRIEATYHPNYISHPTGFIRVRKDGEKPDNGTDVLVYTNKNNTVTARYEILGDSDLFETDFNFSEDEYPIAWGKIR